MRLLVRSLHWFARMADAIVDAIGRACAWIVLAVIGALFAQWPLRELLGAGHVRLDVFYQRLSVRGRALVDLAGSTLFVVPWASIVLWYSVATTARSVAALEQFPETWSPGYWMLKVLLLVFTSLLLLQAAGHVARDIGVLLVPDGDTAASRR
jgi:TRAP-type mannitol/chloroaromatic compound transport system permease small subunit